MSEREMTSEMIDVEERPACEICEDTGKDSTGFYRCSKCGEAPPVSDCL